MLVSVAFTVLFGGPWYMLLVCWAAKSDWEWVVRAPAPAAPPVGPGLVVGGSFGAADADGVDDGVVEGLAA